MGGICSRGEKKSVAFPALKAKLPRMDGKVIAITGCTTGTGFVCARTCAELGAHVVLLNRASARADAALASLRSEFPGSKLTAIPCDLMRFESVREAAALLQKELAETGLDILCNNAGIMATKDEATADGCDTQMQTNHLSHFLLTSLVWPLLEVAAKKNGEARVVNHSSEARKIGKKLLDASYFGKNGGKLGGDSAPCCNPMGSGRWVRYQQSKLANVVFTYALDDKLQAKGSKVKALVCHPGASATNLSSTTAADGGLPSCLVGAGEAMMQTGEDGTAGLLVCCCMQDVQSRQFYGPTGMSGPAELLPEDRKPADEAARNLLWGESEKSTGIKFDL